MAWVRFDPGFTRHKKRLKAGPIANWLWVASVDYCVEHLTDGRLPRGSCSALVAGVSRSALGRAVKRLLDVRAWERDGEDYIVHDFLEYQVSRKEVKRSREAGKERARKFREKHVISTVSHGVANVLVTEPAVLTCPDIKADASRNALRPPTYDPTDPGSFAAFLASQHPPDPAKPYNWRTPSTIGNDWREYPRDAFRFDCPEVKWRGRCVRPDFEGPKPADVRQCPAHRAGRAESTLPQRKRAD